MKINIKRIGHRQIKILILIYDGGAWKRDIYYKVFDRPEKSDALRSRVAKSLIRLKRNKLIEYKSNYRDAFVSITEKGKKVVEDWIEKTSSEKLRVK